MCGADPIEDIADVAAIATGNEEFLPLINAGETAGKDLIEGKGLGKSLIQGAEQGGIALAGQEALGSIGIGEGNTAVNDALGINLSPAATGLPDIGGGISDALSSAGKSISSGFDDVKSSLGITPSSSSSSITDVAPGAGGTTAASGGVAAPGISATAAPEVASNQIATQLDSTATGAIGGDTGLGSVAPGLDTSGIDTAASNFSKSVGNDVSNLGSSSAPAVSASSSGISKLAPLVPLGNIAYQAISGPGKLPSQATGLEAAGAVTAPLIATEKQSLAEGNSGQLTPSQQATIAQYRQNAQNQLIQQLANSGVTDYKNDSRYIQGMQQIEQQAIAQQQQYIQQAIQNGFSAAGAAAGNLSQVANEQLQQDKDFNESLTGALSSLGQLAGGQPNIKVVTGA